MTPKNVLTIAGSDPTGTAGLQADLKTFAARGVFGTAVVTLVTAQDTSKLYSVHQLPDAFIADQIRYVLDDIGAHAIKTGLLGKASTITTVANILQAYTQPYLVVDPVLVDGWGNQIVADAALAAYRETLLPIASVITPNLHEAALLADMPTIQNTDALQQAAQRLKALGPALVFLKGGHLKDGPTISDWLYDGDSFVTLEAPRLPVVNPRGVGCTLSAALAAERAKGYPPLEAARRAHAYLQATIRGSLAWQIGQGRQGVYHAVLGFSDDLAPDSKNKAQGTDQNDEGN